MTFAGGKFGGVNAALAVLLRACLYLALCAFGGKKLALQPKTGRIRP